MFLQIDKQNRNSIAAMDNNGCSITYGALCDYCVECALVIPARSVIFILCENTIGALASYVVSQENSVVPLLLSASMDRGLLRQLTDIYMPAYIWLPSKFINEYSEAPIVFEKYDYTLIKTVYDGYPINDKLAMLMTTSGSTGSPKLVRYKYGNLEANAKNVAKVFGWTKDERPICDLPMHYTMGLNVINSHLYVGATILLITYNLMSVDFWHFIKEQKATNFTGVPFSYEVFSKLRFTQMDLPYLKTFAEGGGKLTDKMFIEIAEYAERTGKRFFATFGTTETSARLAFLPPELALSKCGSIGRAIPEGELFLLDDNGNEIAGDDVEGEMGYRGPNVTMGYAQCREDLLLDDVFCGEYRTGDIACRDVDGCYYIIGRKSRFLKLLGYRVSLDECERLIKTEFNIDCACTGTDKEMVIYITDAALSERVWTFISEKTGLYKSMFLILAIDDIPKNGSGKILYMLLPAK
ncbi:AMP-binding protein [Desulforamulus aeronauticus]|uniref:Acyl-CoA synthetase (AMP-forming)/AMP-acid ligase II n=1 Tax=Desulforamulus aeronauticus DSM 10349 TaxID=1121421 RepID=A0A1M6V3Z2_9FIRM|nr:AMP-binding protein [Desulforamulus aeronauticus]SHK76229.1 Acyl-CoA synthetase (AMP-forming)/AMP-acid ligase II [Desulforamulus aeronauticus DSM 10349]